VKRVLARILCQIAAVAVMIVGLFPLATIIKKSQPDARRSYYDEVYSDYNAILSIIILLVSIAIGIVLLWLGSKLKSKGKAGPKQVSD
jgi:hypothetical protein